MTTSRAFSRRQLFRSLAVAPGGAAAFLPAFHTLAAPERKRVRIRDVQATDRPGLGIELNPDVVRAHLTTGESWWG